MVDTGIDPYVGVAAWLEAHKQNEFAYRPAQDRTAVQRFGELSGANAFLVLLPLFVVMIAFSSFSGERENGTLRQLLSLGVRPRDLLVGKALGLAGALGLVVVPAAIVGVVCLSLTSEFGSPAQDAPRAARQRRVRPSLRPGCSINTSGSCRGSSAWSTSSASLRPRCLPKKP
jgi:ABC-2 type transport system permease protein